MVAQEEVFGAGSLASDGSMALYSKAGFNADAEVK